jgi:hypothetical protein
MDRGPDAERQKGKIEKRTWLWNSRNSQRTHNVPENTHSVKDVQLAKSISELKKTEEDDRITRLF